MIDIIKRIVAAFFAACLGVIGSGAVLGVEIWKSAAMAGIGAVFMILEKLSKSYLDDGVLSMEEVNAAFSTVNTFAPAEIAEKPEELS